MHELKVELYLETYGLCTELYSQDYWKQLYPQDH